MAYYNRRKLLEETLKSIQRSKFKNYEIIVVDDASTERIDDLPVKVIRLEQKDKWYHNSCVPYNIGFSQCSGDLIIIQNAECLHYSNIINYVKNNLNETNYLSFSNPQLL